MNWQAVNFDWNQARAFLVTAETGSFSAAARALKLTQPTLGRQVAALEEELGVVLFERVGRNLSLTPSGRDLLEHVRGMGDAATRLSLSAFGHAEEVAGRVCVSASDLMAAFVLPRVAVKLREVAPQIELEILASNTLSDLQRREADIAVRHVRPTEPELFAKLVREEPAGLYAASHYLDRVGRPRTPEEAARLDFISAGDAETMVFWLNRMGVPVTAANLRLTCENGVVGWECTRLGLGVYPMDCRRAEATPGLERVLPDVAAITFPVWLAVHRELQTSRRIRLVYDLLAEELASATP